MPAFTDYLSCTRASTGYAQTVAGVLTPFAANELRRTDKGLLVEEARTNVFLWSQTIGAWDTHNAVVTSNTTVAPDGTITAGTAADTSSDTRHILNASGSPGLGDYVHSVYAKAGTASWFQMQLTDLVDNQWANFNVTTGVVGNKTGGTTARIEALANGWYRCSVTGNNSTDSLYCQIFFINNADSAILEPYYIGSGQTVHFWGRQVELGTYPSSYILTTSAVVTRASDVVSLIGLAATTIDGAAVSAVASIDVVPIAAQFTLLADPSVGYPIFSQSDTSVAHYGSAIVAKTGLASLLTTASKLGAAWDGSGFSVTGQGLTPATSAAAPVNYGTIYLGSDSISGTNFIDAYIRRLSLWNTRISDAELQELTE